LASGNLLSPIIAVRSHLILLKVKRSLLQPPVAVKSLLEVVIQIGDLTYVLLEIESLSLQIREGPERLILAISKVFVHIDRNLPTILGGDTMKTVRISLTLNPLDIRLDMISLSYL
jgi:hypothetical protein